MSTSLFVVTDDRTVPLKALTERLASLAERGFGSELAVVLRNPQLEGSELMGRARLLRAITKSMGARFIVDDRVDIALLSDADGLHLGRTSVRAEDIPPLLRARPGFTVSVSCHSMGELETPRVRTADIVVLSPIFASPGKDAPLGVAALGEAKNALATLLPKPVLVALGGVSPENAAWCIANGADAVAAIRGEPGAIATALRQARRAAR